MTRLARYAGIAVVVTGVIHIICGFWFYRGPLRRIARDRIVNAVEPHEDRDAAVWFMIAGVQLIAFGALANWARNETGRLPRSAGVSMLISGAMIGILMPVSGWPLVMFCGAMLLSGSRRARTT